MDQQKRDILVIGSASIDTKGHAAQPIQAGTSTPGAIRVSVGGVARNVAENLARLGEQVVLLAAVGQDSSGRRILQNAAEAGIDVTHVLVDAKHHTSAYMAVLDETGRLVTSIDDMGMTEELVSPQFLYRHRGLFRQAQMVIVDANLSPAALRTVFRLAAHNGVPVCADPTSATLAPRLCPHLGELMLITPNEAEAEALCGSRVDGRRTALAAAKELVRLGVEIAIVTLGRTGLVYATSRESGHVPALEVGIVDLTGAGDALTAAVVFGLLNNLEVGEAARLGLAAATLTLQSRETVHPGLGLERLYDQLGK